MSDSDLDTRIDRLYALPLVDFTETRNALAKEVRSQGDRESADRIKALKKPPVTAWAVNQVVHHYPAVWSALVESSTAVRDAHASGPAGLGEAVAARKAALTRARETAEGVLQRAGHALSGGQARRVSGTLESLAAGAHEGVPGRLAADLEPPGFGGLAGLEFAAVVRPATPSAVSGKQGATDGAAPEVRRPAVTKKTAVARNVTPAAEKKADAARKKAAQSVADAESLLAALLEAAEEAGRARSDGERQHADSVAAFAAAARRLEDARRAAAEAEKAEGGLGARLTKLQGAEERAAEQLAAGKARLAEARRALREI